MLAGYGILAVVTVLLVLTSARPQEISSCDPSTTSAPNSSFQANLNLLVEALPVNASSALTGFATLSAGTASQAYAMALCRGDANASSCATCSAVAFRAAGENCPNNTGVIMYEDDCVLRFANRQFLDFLDAEQWQAGELSTQTIPANMSVPSVAAAWFSAAATAILTAVSGRASSNATAGNAKKYFTTGEVDFDPRIYVLAQCVPVLTPTQDVMILGGLREHTATPTHKVWNHWRRGTISQMMDQAPNEHSRNQQLRCVHVGLMCVQADPGDRPEISKVIFMLTRDNTELQPLEEPAFFFGSFSLRKNLHSSSGASSNSNFLLGDVISVNEVTITEPYPR